MFKLLIFIALIVSMSLAQTYNTNYDLATNNVPLVSFENQKEEYPMPNNDQLFWIPVEELRQARTGDWVATVTRRISAAPPNKNVHQRQPKPDLVDTQYQGVFSGLGFDAAVAGTGFTGSAANPVEWPIHADPREGRKTGYLDKSQEEELLRVLPMLRDLVRETEEEEARIKKDQTKNAQKALTLDKPVLVNPQEGSVPQNIHNPNQPAIPTTPIVVPLQFNPKCPLSFCSDLVDSKPSTNEPVVAYELPRGIVMEARNPEEGITLQNREDFQSPIQNHRPFAIMDSSKSFVKQQGEDIPVIRAKENFRLLPTVLFGNEARYRKN